MHKLFIEAKYKGDFDVSKIKIPQNKIGLCSSVQFIKFLDDVKKHLEEQSKEVILIKGNHSKHCGQILGCDVLQGLDKYDVEAFLYIGDGLFHPKALLLKNELPVFSYNPRTEEMKEISSDDIKRMKIKQKIAINKFHSNKNIGIIITTKHGQNQSKKAEELEKEYENKNLYTFIADTIDFLELENFPFIECWVNTACPRISFDDMAEMEKSIVDINDIL